MSVFLPLVQLIGEGSGMNIKHIAKMAVTITALFLGFQFGRDIANKVNSSSSSSPA